MRIVYEMLYEKQIDHKQYIIVLVQMLLSVSIVAMMYKEGNKK